MMYDPQVNDYVIWTNRSHIQGWVYFKCKDYITIETHVWEKTEENYAHCLLHRNDRVLVLCYPTQWNELKCIKSRSSKYESDHDLT